MCCQQCWMSRHLFVVVSFLDKKKDFCHVGVIDTCSVGSSALCPLLLIIIFKHFNLVYSGTHPCEFAYTCKWLSLLVKKRAFYNQLPIFKALCRTSHLEYRSVYPVKTQRYLLFRMLHVASDQVKSAFGYSELLNWKQRQEIINSDAFLRFRLAHVKPKSYCYQFVVFQT